MNMINELKSCRGGVFSFATEKKYASIECVEDGFWIRLTNNPKDNCITRIIRDNRFQIPIRILRDYGLTDNCMMQKASAEEYFIIGRNKCHSPLKPIPGHVLFQKTKIPDLDDCDFSYERQISCYKVFLDERLRIGKNQKITLHMGEQQFIEITEFKSEDLCFLDIEDIKKEFGAQLQNFVGDEITYICKTANNHAFNIPHTFAKRSGIQKDSVVRVFKLKDGRIIITPPQKKCAFDGDIIEPVVQKETKINVCRDCAENAEEVGNVLALVKEIKKIQIEMNLKLQEKEKLLREKEKQELDNSRKISELQNMIGALANENKRYKSFFQDMAKVISNIGGNEMEELDF